MSMSTDREVRCEVDEEVRQLGRTRDMVFDPATLVSYISHVMTLLPGDVVSHRHAGRGQPARGRARS